MLCLSRKTTYIFKQTKWKTYCHPTPLFTLNLPEAKAVTWVDRSLFNWSESFFSVAFNAREWGCRKSCWSGQPVRSQSWMGTWTVNQNMLILKIFKSPKQRKPEDLAECEPEPCWGAGEAAKLCSPSPIRRQPFQFGGLWTYLMRRVSACWEL